MLVYRLCISVLLTCELHLIGLSQINTRWSVTSLVGLLTHCLRDYVNVFSMIYLLPVVFMLLVQVQVIDWKDQLLGNDVVLQFVDDDVNPDSLTSPTVQSLYYCEMTLCSMGGATDCKVGYKTGFARERAKKNLYPRLFQIWGYKQANISRAY